MFKNSSIERGGRTTLFLQQSGDLFVYLNWGQKKIVRQEVKEAKARGIYRDDIIFQNLIQDFIDNSALSFISDEDKEHYGMLTGCELIVSEDVDVLDCGHAIIHGRIWWHERYALDDAIESMLSKEGLRLNVAAGADPGTFGGRVTCPWCGRVTG